MFDSFHFNHRMELTYFSLRWNRKQAKQRTTVASASQCISRFGNISVLTGTVLVFPQRLCVWWKLIQSDSGSVVAPTVVVKYAKPTHIWKVPCTLSTTSTIAPRVGFQILMLIDPSLFLNRPEMFFRQHSKINAMCINFVQKNPLIRHHRPMWAHRVYLL